MNTEGLPGGRIDTNKASHARIYDYFLGGKENLEVDRQAAEQILQVSPEARQLAVANRQFVVRAVRYIAEQGIDQFIDIGAGLPTSPNVFEVAREVHPRARVVSVDSDPFVLAHNQDLDAADEGLTTIEGDVRDPDQILANPELTALIDFNRPVAVLLVAVLHFVADEEEPAGIVARILERLTPGSHVAVSSATTTSVPEETFKGVAQAFQQSTTRPAVARSADQILAWFGDLSFVEPGLVDIVDWRPQLQEWLPTPGPLSWPPDLRTSPGLRFVGGVAEVIG
ncbi:MAG: SAM-dependent methyltransferase [Carbonactinosporaceae bacterium]